MFKTVECFHENLQARHPRPPRERCQLRVQLRRDSDAHLRIVAHALAVDAPGGTARFSGRSSRHRHSFAARTFCAFTNSFRRLPIAPLYSKLSASPVNPKGAEMLRRLSKLRTVVSVSNASHRSLDEQAYNQTACQVTFTGSARSSWIASATACCEAILLLN